MTFQGYFEFAINLFILPSFVRRVGYMWDDVFVIHFSEAIMMCRQLHLRKEMQVNEIQCSL